jgi:2-hydroxychromene-2-carboxylate isomerase
MTDRAEGRLAPIMFYYDYSSPYAYMAASRIDDIAAAHGRVVHWRPILLGAIYKLTGASPLLDQPIKGAYIKRDMERCARLMGLHMEFPENMTFAEIAPARATVWARDQGEDQARKLGGALLNHCFGTDGNIRGVDEVVQVATGVGFDGAALSAALASDELKQRLRDDIDAAMSAGVCGAPLFIVDEEPFWGADRLDHVERWLATGGW